MSDDTITISRKEYEELRSANALLRFELDELKRLIYGQKSERHVPKQNPSQAVLDLGLLEQEEEESKKETISYTRKKRSHKGGGRNELPDSLPVIEKTIEPEQDVSHMKLISTKETTVLEYEEAKLYKLKYLRPVYAPTNGNGDIVVAPLPFRPVEKGLPGPKLATQVVMDKYVYHMPVYRQCKKFKRMGVDLCENTINGWIRKYADLLTPLYECAKSDILKLDYLQADETTLKVLKHPTAKKGKSHRGYLVPYHSPIQKTIYFSYQPYRNQKEQEDFLSAFRGYLQTDGHNSYDSVARRKNITHMGCLSHARRKFEKAINYDKVRAEYALRIIRLLFRVEKMAKTKGDKVDYDKRGRLRKRHSKKLMSIFKAWLDEQALSGPLPKPSLGKAFNYTLSRWDELNVFLNDGRLEISNNPIESLIRDIAVSRKNWLFGGSPAGARWAAIMFTFSIGCRLNNLDFSTYLMDVASRINDHIVQRLPELLPWNWKPPEKSKIGESPP